MANSPRTYAEKLALLKQLQEEIQADRTNQLDSIVKEFTVALESNGFSLQEGSDALSRLFPTRGRASTRRGSGAPRASKERPYTIGVKYRNPNGSDEWVPKGRGALPKWVRSRIDGLSHDQAVAEFNRLANG
ncbi:MAG: H-NS histone family protein [Burkholderiaceae bacterium]